MATLDIFTTGDMKDCIFLGLDWGHWKEVRCGLVNGSKLEGEGGSGDQARGGTYTLPTLFLIIHMHRLYQNSCMPLRSYYAIIPAMT
jgi:hypothetical protein